MKQIIKETIKEIWRLMPIRFFIGLIARIYIAAVVLSYLSLIGGENLLATISLNLWVFIPVYYSIRNTYYDYKHNLIENLNPNSLIKVPTETTFKTRNGKLVTFKATKFIRRGDYNGK